MLPFNQKQNAVALVSAVVPGPLVLLNVNLESYEAAASWFQLFDKAAVPEPDDAPTFSWRVAAASRINAEMPGPSLQQLIGQAFTLGLVFAWSSTGDVYTPAAVGGKWWATGVRL